MIYRTNIKNIFIIFVLISILFLTFPVSNGEIVNYEINQSKVLKIDDIANINYINEYPYEVYINNSLYGTFQKGQNILIPDNSNIMIYVSTPIKSDFGSVYDVGKVYLTLGVMYFIGFGILIILLWVGIKKLTGRT